MAPIAELWVGILHVFSFLSPFPFQDSSSDQQPLMVPEEHSQNPSPHYPIFEPPNGPEFEKIFCNYSSMLGFEFCSTSGDRSCWIRNKKTGENYTIHTDYENLTPDGTIRHYDLYASEMPLSPDGYLMPDGQVFNQSYPGPRIQACWGDTIEVTVHNNLQENGTSVHWHGVRQWFTPEMDGVNAVTQCAIPPNGNFTYTFKAQQYGTSWYHSHYSLQYANGLLGPLTIYGPSSAPYDTAKDPILISDWRHQGAFGAWAYAQFAIAESILINGIGPYNTTSESQQTLGGPGRYSTGFEKGKKHLLRLINTSVFATFVFSIDGHYLTVVETDFVPIKPYNTTSITIGIGQRYNVIVEATPETVSPDGNYWIRTVPVPGCSPFNGTPDNRTGIIRYDPESNTDPSSCAWEFDVSCSDEPYEKLVPVYPWNVTWRENSFAYNFSADIDATTSPPYYPPEVKQRFGLTGHPLWLDFKNPTILNPIVDSSPQPWLAIVETDGDPETWIVFLIEETTTTNTKSHALEKRLARPEAHPIHLHGHDFVILVQSNTSYTTFEEARPRMKFEGAPRRDVAMLPKGGYLVIAFKADNPGPWLMHCHIAWHASDGLAAQILENPKLINISSSNREKIDQNCAAWNAWLDDQSAHLQDDSGIKIRRRR